MGEGDFMGRKGSPGGEGRGGSGREDSVLGLRTPRGGGGPCCCPRWMSPARQSNRPVSGSRDAPAPAAAVAVGLLARRGGRREPGLVKVV